MPILARLPQVGIDDVDAVGGPAEGGRPFDEGVLIALALPVVLHLLGARLAHVDVGPLLVVPHGDLLRADRRATQPVHARPPGQSAGAVGGAAPARSAPGWPTLAARSRSPPGAAAGGAPAPAAREAARADDCAGSVASAALVAPSLPSCSPPMPSPSLDSSSLYIEAASAGMATTAARSAVTAATERRAGEMGMSMPLSDVATSGIRRSASG